jgi:hypothetical protein
MFASFNNTINEKSKPTRLLKSTIILDLACLYKHYIWKKQHELYEL